MCYKCDTNLTEEQHYAMIFWYPWIAWDPTPIAIGYNMKPMPWQSIGPLPTPYTGPKTRFHPLRVLVQNTRSVSLQRLMGTVEGYFRSVSQWIERRRIDG